MSVPSKVSFLTFIFSTVNGHFGSGIMSKTGILLNNEMLDFSIPGVQRVIGAGPPRVRINIRYYSSFKWFVNREEPTKTKTKKTMANHNKLALNEPCS